MLRETGSAPPAVLILHVDEDGVEPKAGMQMSTDMVDHFMCTPHGKAMLAEMSSQLIDASSAVHREASKSLGMPVNLVVSIFEAWTSRRESSPDGRASVRVVPPAKDPGREEAIEVTLQSANGPVMGICPIQRPSDSGQDGGKPTVTIEPLSHNASFTGNMVPGSESQKELVGEVIQAVDHLIEQVQDIVGDAEPGDPKDANDDGSPGSPTLRKPPKHRMH